MSTAKIPVIRLFPEFYEDVAAGRKTVEGRLARTDGLGPQGVRVGDIVRVLPRGSSGSGVTRMITKLEPFQSFSDMLKKHLRAALPRAKDIAAGEAVYRSLYSGDKEALRGVVAVHWSPAEVKRKQADIPIALHRNSTSFLFELSRLLATVDASPENPNVPAKDEYFGVPVKGLRLHQARTLVYSVAPEFRTDARGIVVAHEMGTGKGVLMAAMVHQVATRGTPVVLMASRTLMGNFGSSVKKFEEVTGLTFPHHMLRYANASAGNSSLQVVRAIDSLTAEELGAVGEVTSAMDKDADKKLRRREADEEERAEKKRKGKRAEKGPATAKALSAQLAREIATFDNIALFIDEAHLFTRSVTNGATNATTIYRILRRSPLARVFLFTGTPGVDDPFELALLADMVGPLKPAPFTENYDDFRRAFVGVESKPAPAPKTDDVAPSRHVVGRAIPRRSEKFMNRAVGLFSFFEADQSGLPKLLPYEIHRVPMDDPQWELYLHAREREREEELNREEDDRGGPKRSPFTRPGAESGGVSTYRQASRQAGNSYFASGELASPKARVALDIIEKEPQMCIVYSQYRGRGADAIVAEARRRGWKEFGDPGAEGSPQFALISGAIEPEIRQHVVDAANNPANVDGSRIKMVILSVVAALGVSFIYSETIIIFEPFWNEAMHQQIIARVRRFDSNPTKDPKTRVAKAHVLFAYPPERAAADVIAGDLTDEHMWTRAEENTRLLRQFRGLLRRVSIEANVNAYTGARLCAPTGQPLYADNFATDLTMPDPCAPYERVEVSVEPVELSGETLYYSKDASSIFGIRVFRHDEAVDAYVPLPESDPAVMEALEVLA